MIHPLTHPIIHPVVHGVVGHRLRGGRKPTDAIILDLFANGEQGGYYDPYDLTDAKLAWVAANPSFTSAQFMAQFPNHTLFQGANGSIPVTGSQQPVGLALDKRFGGVRGENLIVNGDFSNELDGWTVVTLGAGVSGYPLVDDGVVYAARGNDFTDQVFYEQLNRPSPVGSIEIRLSSTGVGGRIRVYPNSNASGTPIATITGTGDLRQIVTNSSTLISIRFDCTVSNAVAGLSRVSIRHIAGNHLQQTVSAARPLWQNNNGIKTFYRDGVDDALNVTLPAATYTRITADTVNGYTVDTINHAGGALNILGSSAGNSAGYILIDRTLTPTEAANIEAIFNERAGL